jgi:hypothetical protein
MKKIIYTIFAGRKRYLEIQKKFIDILLENQLITEVHLWEYTHNSDDRNYIIDLCKTNNKYKIIYPKYKISGYWKDYYRYYTENIEDNTILIKADDDIVYIDINNFKKFIKSVVDDVLYLPNIINNDVCAYYQVKNGMHNLIDSLEMEICSKKMLNWGDGAPMTSWYCNFDKADCIHQLFLSNPEKLHYENNMQLIDYGNRISINLFATTSNGVRKYFSEFLNAGTNDDEFFLSVITRKFNKMNKINLNLTIVHFQFGPQNGKLLDEKYLEKYNLLADKSITESIYKD